LESPTSAKKKVAQKKQAVNRARAGELEAPSLLVCDPDGNVAHSKPATVAVASMDGTIYDAEITPVSPVHCAAKNKKQKALFRASPKNGPLSGPPPVYIAAHDGEIRVPERWDFFIPEVNLAC
jgi:hypothetical protein